MRPIADTIFRIVVVLTTTLWMTVVLLLAAWTFVHVSVRELSSQAGASAWQGKLIYFFQAYLGGVAIAKEFFKE
jgi:hypothetical protein